MTTKTKKALHLLEQVQGYCVSINQRPSKRSQHDDYYIILWYHLQERTSDFMDKWEVKVWLAVAHGARDKSVCMPDKYASIYRDGYVSGIYGTLEWLGHKVEVELDPNRIDLEWIHKTRKDIDRVVDREVRRVLNLD